MVTVVPRIALVPEAAVLRTLVAFLPVITVVSALLPLLGGFVNGRSTIFSFLTFLHCKGIVQIVH